MVGVLGQEISRRHPSLRVRITLELVCLNNVVLGIQDITAISGHGTSLFSTGASILDDLIAT